MKDIYIGVDGGATKCKTVIEDANDNVLSHGIGGPANIRMSVKDSWQNILASINEALKDTDIKLNDDDYRFHIGMGLAGTELDSAVDEFLTQPHPFTTIRLESDAYTACLGAHGGKDGGMIIIGTGCVGMAVQHGKKFQVGGWGFPYGDEGSGAWFGLEATRLTFQAYDGRVTKSPLLEAVMQKFNNDPIRLLNWANTSQSTQYAQLAPLVFEHAKNDDPWSLTLIKEGARNIDNIFHALEKARNNPEPIPFSLFGGVTGPITPWLCEELQKRLEPVKYDATKGAIFMIKDSVQQ